MIRRVALAALAATLAAGAAQAQQRETISFESRQKGQPVQVTADVYWPAAAGPVPALVIHHGSGGVSDSREGRIDRTRIGITGFSKGGTSALLAAHEQQVVAAGIPAGLRYALHVPFYPSCSAQYYQPRTTGAPIYMLLGGADTYVGFEPCQSYAGALQAMGGRVEVTVFPGAMHGFDSGRTYFDPRGENYAKCVFQQQANGSWIERASGVMTVGTDGRPVQGALTKALATCRTLGVSGGPNDAAARQSMEDLKGYVHRHLQGG